MKSESTPRHWTVLYAKHVLIAWPGLFVALMLAGVLAAVTLPPLSNLFAPEVMAPWIPTWVICGGLAGYYFNRRDRTRAAALVFLPPLALFIESAREWRAAPVPFNSWASLWSNFFTSNCGGSECLYVAMATAPLYAGIAYSVGAWLRWRQRRRGQRASGAASETAA